MSPAARAPSSRPTRDCRTRAFYRTPDYIGNVTDGRLRTLLFFWATIALTWVLAGGRADPWVALLASASVATLPPIVAHAGFATTDVAFMAALLLLLVALRRCLLAPSTRSAALAGAALGVAVATKFTTLVFLPPAVVAILAVHAWPERRACLALLARPAFWRGIAVLAAVAVATLWLCYGFRVGRLAELPARFPPFGQMPTTGWPAFVRDWPLPAHEFVHGLLYLKAHTDVGQATRFMGQESPRASWFYYPVVLATKTPGPFLLFAAAGLGGLLFYRDGRSWRWIAGLALAALGILLVSLASPIKWPRAARRTDGTAHRGAGRRLRPCRMKLPLKSLPDHPVTGWIAISDGPYRGNGGRVNEDPCGVIDSPGPRRRMAKGWLNWLHAYEPVAILEKTVRIYHIAEPAPRAAR